MIYVTFIQTNWYGESKSNKKNTYFRALTTVVAQILFWAPKPCGIVNWYRDYRGTCFLRHRGDWLRLRCMLKTRNRSLPNFLTE